MKLCYLVYIVWCLLQSAQGVSHEDKLREPDNTLIEGLALENLELEQDADNKVYSYIEMLSDAEADAIKEEYFKDHEVDGVLRDMSHNEFEGHDQPIALPWGRRELVPGDGHTWCGPYTYHYTKAQDCHEVGTLYHRHHRNTHITVKECEDICKKQYRCNAFNWSPEERLGCVLRECGYSNAHFPPKPFPMPIGLNRDFVSFSKFKPDKTPECQHPDWPAKHASFDTPNNYCGPYNKIWGHDHKHCRHLRPTIYKVTPLQCESKCDAKLECTGFLFDPSGEKCILVSCTGRVQPVPMDSDRFNVWTRSYSKDPLPGKTVNNCYTDDRTVKY